MSAPIVLLTDFGTSDWYVAEMKGVLLGAAPASAIVDFSHHVPPGDVAHAAFLLARGHRAFPADTVFVAVVDPGVGTERHPIAVQAGGRWYVGPDNGVLEAAFETAGAETRVIEDAALLERASETFHGRDVFAPVAARLALHGAAAWRDLGRTLESPVRVARLGAIDHAGPAEIEHAAESGRLRARVVYVDRFGNAITSLNEIELEAWLGTRDPRGIVLTAHGALGARATIVRGLSTTYGATDDRGRGGDEERDAPGRPLALVGSSGMIEIALAGGHAALHLGLAPGDAVDLSYED
jgi:S-adenosylmethionine hydrolase